LGKASSSKRKKPTNSLKDTTNVIIFSVVTEEIDYCVYGFVPRVWLDFRKKYRTELCTVFSRKVQYITMCGIFVSVPTTPMLVWPLFSYSLFFTVAANEVKTSMLHGNKTVKTGTIGILLLR